MNKKIILTGLLLAFSINASADLNFGSPEDDNAKFKLNEDYTIIKNNISNKDQVDVINFFSYGCKDCVDMTKQLESWSKNMPYYTKLYQSPISPKIETSYPARIYFTMEKLNRTDLNLPFMEASVDGKTDFSNFDVVTAWFDSRGISPVKFSEAFDSNEVVSKIYAAPNVIKMYNITSLPTVVINNTYQVNASSFEKNKDDFKELIDFLVEKSMEDNKR